MRRLAQAIVLLGLFAAVKAQPVLADPETCRDICFWQQGVCEGRGDTWHYDCSEIDPGYTGTCDLDAYCWKAG